MIDPNSNTFVGNIALPGAMGARAVALAPGGARLYVANAESASVSVVDVAGHAWLTNVPLPGAQGTASIAVNPVNGRIYTANTLSSTVSIIDPVLFTVTTINYSTSQPFGFAPVSIAVSADGTRVYTANSSTTNVSVIDALTNQVVDTINTLGGSGPTASPPTRSNRGSTPPTAAATMSACSTPRPPASRP